MKKLLFSLVCFLFVYFSNAQREFSYTEGDTTFIMKRYVFMMLDGGEVKRQKSYEGGQFQELEHDHLNKLAENGKLILAGPFEGGGEHRGLLIFDVETVEEALKLEGEDPSVKSGRLKMNAFYWWGAKGTVLN